MSKPSVPIEELEQLADKWEETLEWAKEHEGITTKSARNVSESRLEDLQEVIDEYSNE